MDTKLDPTIIFSDRPGGIPVGGWDQPSTGSVQPN
jgi:hypothetical protein